jgi:hypothetical protein
MMAVRILKYGGAHFRDGEWVPRLQDASEHVPNHLLG